MDTRDIRRQRSGCLVTADVGSRKRITNINAAPRALHGWLRRKQADGSACFLLVLSGRRWSCTGPYSCTLPYGPVQYILPYLTVRYGTVRYGTVYITYLTVRYGTVRYSIYITLPYGTVRYGTVVLDIPYLTVRYGTVVLD